VPKDFLIIQFSNLLIMGVPDEGYSSGVGTAFPSGAPEFTPGF